MSDLLDLALVKLNAVGLQQKDIKLYDFLKLLLSSTDQVNNKVSVVAAGGGGGGGGITGSGTAGSISEWATSTSLTDVDAAGISAALDLL